MESKQMLGQISNFAIRLVKRGEKYGREDCLTWDKDEPAVEFYYLNNEVSKSFELRGYFVSRYYYTTLRFSSKNKVTESGLCLDGGDPYRMSLSAEEMQQVMALVDAAIAGFATPDQIQGWRNAWKIRA
ncbi:MAG: hypothetical protein KGZ70_12845 [Hydrogenophaga sp.]|nr:hypothetical protein [Hydrogenophaga sp.]